MRKRDRDYLGRYYYSTKSNLLQCYKNPSRRKIAAEIQCRTKMQSQDGYGFRILSFNTCQFTCGWMTGDSVLHVETPTRSIEIKDAADYLPF